MHFGLVLGVERFGGFAVPPEGSRLGLLWLRSEVLGSFPGNEEPGAARGVQLLQTRALTGIPAGIKVAVPG